jgi:Na+/H+-dicarboxylate symporter
MKGRSCCAPVGSDKTNLYIMIAVGLGLISGFLDLPLINQTATVISQIFISLLKLVSLPIIFLSIVATTSGMESIDEIKYLGKKVIRYTLLTTLIAAAIALAVFLMIDPVRSQISAAQAGMVASDVSSTYITHLMNMIPSNVIHPFSTNNVIGVLFLAIALSLSILALPKENRAVLHSFFSSLYRAIMTMTLYIVSLMPIAVWGFVILFVNDLRNGLEVRSLVLYLSVVLIANALQSILVLPLLLKWKGLSPLKVAKAVLPALSVAFFSKSSSAALPTAMRSVEENLNICPKVSGFSMPLCTTINMNACAGFILTTVLFVSMSNGVVYSPAELLLWIVIATIAAVGNAGVPMGCYFLASAFLATMNIPLSIMGVILPFYSLLDMLESAINVWSDVCVTAVVQQDVRYDEASVLEPQVR